MKISLFLWHKRVNNKTKKQSPIPITLVLPGWTNSPLLCLLTCTRGRAWRQGSDPGGRRCRATTTPASPRGSRGCKRGVSPSTWSLAGPALAAGCSAAAPPTPEGDRCEEEWVRCEDKHISGIILWSGVVLNRNTMHMAWNFRHMALWPLRRHQPSRPLLCRSVCRCLRLSRWESPCWPRPRPTRCPCRRPLRLPLSPPLWMLLQLPVTSASIRRINYVSREFSYLKNQVIYNKLSCDWTRTFPATLPLACLVLAGAGAAFFLVNFFFLDLAVFFAPLLLFCHTFVLDLLASPCFTHTHRQKKVR